MKIVILDGYTENPGDLTWEPLEKLGQVTVTGFLMRSLRRSQKRSAMRRSW